jgi:uncharacterized membrane protein YfcA
MEYIWYLLIGLIGGVVGGMFGVGGGIIIIPLLTLSSDFDHWVLGVLQVRTYQHSGGAYGGGRYGAWDLGWCCLCAGDAGAAPKETIRYSRCVRGYEVDLLVKL